MVDTEDHPSIPVDLDVPSIDRELADVANVDDDFISVGIEICFHPCIFGVHFISFRHQPAWMMFVVVMDRWWRFNRFRVDDDLWW